MGHGIFKSCCWYLQKWNWGQCWVHGLKVRTYNSPKLVVVRRRVEDYWRSIVRGCGFNSFSHIHTFLSVTPRSCRVFFALFFPLLFLFWNMTTLTNSVIKLMTADFYNCLFQLTESPTPLETSSPSSSRSSRTPDQTLHGSSLS
jgi:hypothetical protein